MTARIYHMGDEGRLDPMNEEPFPLEDDLQELVARHPKLLSGEQIDPEDPRRWILIGREQGIPDTDEGGYRWAVDHLLIDQDAIPTLVEVKRSTNSQVRREIVGQMLDYAAHASRHWNVAEIRQRFEDGVQPDCRSTDEALGQLLQPDGELDADEFWQRVETNLRAARLRLLFVTDGMPDELTRIVEFLNEHMPDIQVLAVEIKQFRGATGRTLVPRVIGRTAAASARSTGARHPLTQQDLLDRMPGPTVREAATRILDVARQRGASFAWGNAIVTIRGHSPGWQRPLAVGWMYPSGVSIGESRAFTFGAGNWGRDFFEELPPSLRGVLENWVDQFACDTYASDVSGPGYKAWVVDYEDAAANIEVLAERLGRVLDNLQRLEIATE